MINVQPVITGMKIMIDMFSLQFMQNAFLAGMMLELRSGGGFIFRRVAPFVFYRRWVAHSAFGG